MCKRFSAGVLCCAVLALAGCGGSGSSQTNNRDVGPASPAVFSTDLNALCRGAKTASGGNATKAAAALSGDLSEFKAITPPPSQRAGYAKFLAAMQSLAADVKSHDSAAAHADTAKLAALAKQLHVPGCAL